MSGYLAERLTNGTHAFQAIQSDLPRGLTIAEYRRIRTYNAEHPGESIQQVADALETSVDKVVLAYAGAGAIVTSEDEEAGNV